MFEDGSQLARRVVLHKSVSTAEKETHITLFLFFPMATGHVDAGKSTLMGHLLYLCGHVDQRDMHKYKSESSKVSPVFAMKKD